MENSRRKKRSYKTNENERLRKSTQYKQWREEVFERDKYTCQQCGEKRNLHPHHIKPFATHKEHRFNVNNGKTLCRRCHGKMHGINYERNTKKLICQHCKKKFPVKEGHYKHKFCSKECGYAYRSKIPSPKKGKRYPHLDKYPMRECPVCKKQFKAVVHKTRNQKYCSIECYLKQRWGKEKLTGEKAKKVE